MQGRVSAEDVASGRAAQGYTCNAEVVSHFGESGGYKVERYVDATGRECAYFDSTLLFPTNAAAPGQLPTGTIVLDMSNPAAPVRTTTLLTPAMQTPHESMVLNPKRGLLPAVMGNPAAYPGIVDIYDATDDCRNPALRSTLTGRHPRPRERLRPGRANVLCRLDRHRSPRGGRCVEPVASEDAMDRQLQHTRIVDQQRRQPRVSRGPIRLDHPRRQRDQQAGSESAGARGESPGLGQHHDPAERDPGDDQRTPVPRRDRRVRLRLEWQPHRKRRSRRRRPDHRHRRRDEAEGRVQHPAGRAPARESSRACR
jgi:hypothetical protein